MAIEHFYKDDNGDYWSMGSKLITDRRLEQVAEQIRSCVNTAEIVAHLRMLLGEIL